MPNYLLRVLFSVSLCLCGSFSAEAAEPTKTLLLLGQKPDGHPPGTHEYMPAQRVVAHLLKDVPGLTTKIVQADDPWTEGPDLLAKADGVVLFVSEGAKWIQADPRRYEAFTRLADRKGGLVALHWATGTKSADNIAGYCRLFGACHGGPDRKYTFFEEVAVDVADKKHPVTAGLGPFRIGEEYYYRLKRADESSGTVHPLLTVQDEERKQQEMVCWTFNRTDGGRSFGFTGLHFHKNWQRPEYRRLIAQAVLWTMNLTPPAGMKFDVPDELLTLESTK